MSLFIVGSQVDSGGMCVYMVMMFSVVGPLGFSMWLDLFVFSSDMDTCFCLGVEDNG